MYNKNNKTADIVEVKGMYRRTTVLSRGAGQCCPFLNRVRYYKTESLKDEKEFKIACDGQTDIKRKVCREFQENSGTSMMYYL